MSFKLKKTLIMLLCVMFSICLLCSCGDDKPTEAEKASEQNEKLQDQYVARITAYKEYYEEIEKNYYAVNGAILVHENGMPYMVLCCQPEQDVYRHKIQLIDYKNGKAELNGEKEFYRGGNYYSIELAFVDDRCVMEIWGDDEYGTEYWEFEKDNLVAQKLSEQAITEFRTNVRSCSYIYDISEKPYEYLYTYVNDNITIYDKKSDVATVNKIAVQKLYDYMQLDDEQKAYFSYPWKYEDGSEVLMLDVVNIYSCNVMMPLSYHRWMNGVSFKQCLNELIKEPIYHIEDLMIKELNFDWYNKYSEDMSQIAVERKEEELNNIYDRMPKKNPYSTDEELLEVYYSYVESVWEDMYLYGGDVPVGSDLATIMTMDGHFANELKLLFEEDYVFTSDKFNGATWKDIVLSGDDTWPILTLTKNGNTLEYPIVNNAELKKIADAYLAFDADGLFNSFDYVDEDDVPEFITQGNDGSFSIYTYKNGTVTLLEHDEAIGWGEYSLKEYVPKKNKIILRSMYAGGDCIEAAIQGNKIVYVGPYTEEYVDVYSVYSTISEAEYDITYWDSEISNVVDAYKNYPIEGNVYVFAYIDDDNIPELVTNAYDTWNVYTYKNGTVIDTELGYNGYFFSYMPKKNVIKVSERGVEEYSDFFYTINAKGKIEGINEDEIPNEAYASFGSDRNVYRALEYLIQNS